MGNFFSNHYYHLGDILFEMPELYQAFELFLKMKLCSENLAFLKAVDDIYFGLGDDHKLESGHLPEFDKKKAQNECRTLYRKFIAEDSEQQINLPATVFKQIGKDMKRIKQFRDPISIFDRAYDCISSLIHKESLPNFYKSEHFKRWYEKQREINAKQLKKDRRTKKKLSGDS